MIGIILCIVFGIIVIFIESSRLRTAVKSILRPITSARGKMLSASVLAICLLLFTIYSVLNLIHIEEKNRTETVVLNVAEMDLDGWTNSDGVKESPITGDVVQVVIVSRLYDGSLPNDLIGLFQHPAVKEVAWSNPTKRAGWYQWYDWTKNRGFVAYKSLYKLKSKDEHSSSLSPVRIMG